MRRVWEYIYWRLPVGKRQFFDKANDLVKKADSLRQILESGIKNSYNHQNELYNQMSGKIDGLSNEVLKDEMLEEIKRVDDYNHACDKLILLAKSRGGRDNITVLLFGGEV